MPTKMCLSDDELWKTCTETITNEVKDCMEQQRVKIVEFWKRSNEADLDFKSTIKKVGKTVNMKTDMVCVNTEKVKASCEDEIGDPDQPEFDETTKAAPKKRVPSPKKSKKAESSKAVPAE